MTNEMRQSRAMMILKVISHLTLKIAHLITGSPGIIF